MLVCVEVFVPEQAVKEDPVVCLAAHEYKDITKALCMGGFYTMFAACEYKQRAEVRGAHARKRTNPNHRHWNTLCNSNNWQLR